MYNIQIGKVPKSSECSAKMAEFAGPWKSAGVLFPVSGFVSGKKGKPR